jgi:hypothetical protein
MNQINSHPRSIIRNSIINELSGKTDAEDRVYGNRAKPLFDQFLPAILVYAKDENILENQFEYDGISPIKTELEIAIEAVILGGDNFDEKLDEIASQIENSLDGFEIETRKSDILKLKSTEIDSSIEGSKVYGAVRLTYSITYRTMVKQPNNDGIIPTDIQSNFNITSIKK